MDLWARARELLGGVPVPSPRHSDTGAGFPVGWTVSVDGEDVDYDHPSGARARLRSFGSRRKWYGMRLDGSELAFDDSYEGRLSALVFAVGCRIICEQRGPDRFRWQHDVVPVGQRAFLTIEDAARAALAWFVEHGKK